LKPPTRVRRERKTARLISEQEISVDLIEKKMPESYLEITSVDSSAIGTVKNRLSAKSGDGLLKYRKPKLLVRETISCTGRAKDRISRIIGISLMGSIFRLKNSTGG
jgi:hypothetical protein